jgi:hypothetical protein
MYKPISLYTICSIAIYTAKLLSYIKYSIENLHVAF